jgi:ribose 1,5-bisphosphokinase
VYVIGPSGAGKDSVLAQLRHDWPLASSAYWAQRTITRALRTQGEQHESVDSTTFENLRRQGAFAMHWTANGLCYGVRQQELHPVNEDRWVFVNGSRAYLPELLNVWPQATVVHIGASREILASRLAARGRESEAEVAARLAREVPVPLPAGTLCIDNNGKLSDAVTALQSALQARELCVDAAACE